MKNHQITLIFLSLLLSACGEFAYKRGASAADLQSAKNECSKLSDEISAENCLKEKGWGVQKLDDMDLFAVASYSESNPNQTPTNQTPKATKNEVAKPSESESASKEMKTSAKPEVDMQETYTINSWWKLGANGQNLETATNECVSSLGEANKPNIKTQQVTRAFAVCMREKGWRGLVTKK